MSKKLLALAAVGLVSYSLVGCSLFGGDDGSSSSATSSSSVGDTSKVVVSSDITLGGSATPQPSYLDVDAPMAYKGTSADTAANAKEIDIQFAPTATDIEFLTPSASAKESVKTNGDQTIRVANLGAIDLTNITKQSQIDSLYASKTGAVKVAAAAKDVLVLKSNKGVAALVKVESLNSDKLASLAVVKVAQK